MKTKRKTITFAPDSDVLQQIEEVKKRGYGVTSMVLNQVIREQLPKVLKRWDGFAKQNESAEYSQ